MQAEYRETSFQWNRQKWAEPLFTKILRVFAMPVDSILFLSLVVSHLRGGFGVRRVGDQRGHA